MNIRLMIRLIDVALIILLGFIAISRLKTGYVDLPSGSNNKILNWKFHEANVHIYKNSFNLQDVDQLWKCQTLRELEKNLIKQKKKYNKEKIKLMINIKPHESCIMQKFIDVIDICQRNEIEENIDYESIE